MDQPDAILPSESVLQLGQVIGQSQTFALIAGRCSAAQAEALLRLREEKQFLHCAVSWKEFCPRYLRMSARHADRIIGLWQRFGPGFFELRQILRITPQFYGSIEPLVKDGALHFNDEAIELDPANSEKITGAIEELRRNQPLVEKPEPTSEQRLASLDKLCDTLLARFQELAAEPIDDAGRERFESILERASASLKLLEVEHALP